MAGTSGPPAAGFKFNTFQEIKSHSSILYNERMAILFYLLDMRSVDMMAFRRTHDIKMVHSVLTQIYKNIRTLIRNNPTVRATLNLDTQDEGVYVTDVVQGVVGKMIEYCEINGYTEKRIYIIINELNQWEMLVKDVLQYFHYFIRPDFRQKPDIEIATEKYKEIADSRTIDELRAIVGKRHSVDFENLGSSRIELKNEIEYDEDVDGTDEDVDRTDKESGEDDEDSYN